MRVHIDIDDALVAEIDRQAGSRNRSDFIRRAVADSLRESVRWETIGAAAGAIPASGHEWDEDPAAWVRRQRRGE